MIKTGTNACVAVLGALLLTVTLEAQSSTPPLPPGIELPKPALPSRDIPAEVDKMTRNYGLSAEKATTVKAILEEQTRKAADVAKNDSLSPDERVHRMLAIKDEEITRISDALTPEQRKRYLADVRPAPPEMTAPAGAPNSSSPAGAPASSYPAKQ